MNYSEAGNKSYFELERSMDFKGKTPVSVHFPLNLPYGQSLVFSDCAFNIMSLPVPPDISQRNITCTATLQKIMVQMCSFLPGDPAFIPEFRQIVWKRPAGGYPIACGSIFIRNMEYQLELCTDPFSRAVYARFTVTNRRDIAEKAVVRVFQSRTRERECMDYHYYPFRWDAEKLSHLVKDELVPAVIDAGKFEVAENDSFAFADEDYNRDFGCSRPYIAAPHMRVKQGNGYTRFACELEPEEKSSFTVAVAFDGADPEKISGDFDTVCERSRKFWDSILTDSRCFYGNERESDIFRALQWGSLQLLLDLDSPSLGRICQPSQGGSSERFYVWVWEAMCCLRPMLQLGHFEAVRRVIEFIFKLQDGGYPPEGDFTSLEGAIGTTGPRWANASGSALVLAAEYAELAGDKNFIKEYLPRMFRAARWILNEVKATQRYEADGSKKIGFGVMPMCRATDGDHGYILVQTDLWSLAGVEAFARLLRQLDDPAAAEITARADEYRNNLSDAIDSVRKENGFIDRKLTDDGLIAKVFSISSGAVKLLNVFGDPREERFTKLIRYYENNLFNGRFCGPMFDRVNYIGNSEGNLFTSYLKLGEWKKAHLAAATFRCCGMSQDLYLTQERFSEVDEAFTPWQPNASNNGRYLQLLIESLYLPCPEDEYILCGGVTPFALLSKEHFVLEKLHTPGGTVSLSLEDGVLTLSRSVSFAAGSRFRLPEYFRVLEYPPELKTLPDNCFELCNAVTVLKFKTEVAREKLC